MSERTVLITGASGLIGRWLTRRLTQAGISWVGVDLLPPLAENEGVPHFRGDICDEAFLHDVFAKVSPTEVIHLAARTDLDGKNIDDYKANVQGVENVCASILRTPSVRRLICTSSQLVCKVGHIPVEDTDYRPSTVYGESKVLTEKIVRARLGSDRTWCLVRPTTVWGPGMSAHYTSLLNHIKAGRYFHPGSGAFYKSYSYAGNIAHQYYKMLVVEADAIDGKTFYLADYEPLSLREYIDGLAKGMAVRKPVTVPYVFAKSLAWIGDGLNIMGMKFPYNSFRLNNILTEYVFDLSKTKAVCGELPYSFEDGLEQTVDWYLAGAKR